MTGNEHGRPCTCWLEVSLHDGGCCFRWPAEYYTPGVPLPCGHDSPDLEHTEVS